MDNYSTNLIGLVKAAGSITARKAPEKITPYPKEPPHPLEEEITEEDSITAEDDFRYLMRDARKRHEQRLRQQLSAPPRDVNDTIHRMWDARRKHEYKQQPAAPSPARDIRQTQAQEKALGLTPTADQRQRQLSYAEQTRASQMQRGAALRARLNAQAEAKRRQDAEVRDTAKHRSRANEPILQETRDRMSFNGYGNIRGKEYKAETPGVLWGYNSAYGGHPSTLQRTILQSISDQKLRNGGVLPTEDQAYILADDAVNAFQQNWRDAANNHRLRYKDGENQRMRHDSQDFIYNLYAKDPNTGRSLADGIVRNTTRTPGYTRTV